MKRLFNRTKRPEQKWNGYNESEYDWDSQDEISDDNAFYADEDDEAYYAEEEGLAEDDEANYAEENGLAEDAEMYYAEEDGLAEDEGAYYAEEESLAGNNETYYAEEGGLAEDAEAFYAEDDAYAEDGGEYYADGETVIGEDVYESEEYYEEEYDPEDYGADGFEPEGEMAAASVTGKKNPIHSEGGIIAFLAELWRSLADMSVLDKVIMGTGAVVLILALITGGFFISSRIIDNQISGFVDVGSQLNGIDTIGEAGLLAVADAQIAKMAAASVVAEQQEDENKEYNEQDYQSEIQVVMEYTSIQRDLKIKFVNKKTGKLVANVPFTVNVTDPDGKSSIWSDDDMDGIIYKKDIAPGSYKLAMAALSDEKYSRYTISTASETAKVKKDIEYKQVDVDNEVKSEDEVDVSKEDTKVNETVVESTLQDTVAWVESTKTPAAYIEVSRESITDPKKLVAQTVGKAFLRASETISGGDTGTTQPEETVALTVTLDKTSVSLSVNSTDSFYARARANGVDVSEVDYSVSPSNGCAEVTVAPDGKVTVVGKQAGTDTYTIKATPKDSVKDKYSASEGVSFTVTVTAAATITLDKKEVTVFAEDDELTAITATVANAGTNAPTVSAESSNAGVVKVVKCENNVVYIQGVKAADQAVTVTVKYADVSATCQVKVKANPKNDTTTKLKDDKGVQLYVKVDDKTYREAVYKDFYDKNIKLYKMGEVKYTGWQTIDNKVYFFTAEGKKVTGEQVIQGAKYNFASDGSLVTGSGALGIDVSKWNGKIDWNAVKNSGINYVIIRCGYRGSSAGSLIEDPNFTTNIKGATAAGLKVGVYFFSQAIDEREAVEEASMVISQIKNYKISYPVFLDVESSGGRADSIDKATRTAVCKAFCQTIKNAGYNAGVYANKNWWETKINASELSAYKIWLAQYASTPTYRSRYDLWQYRSTGKVSGISGNVDMNLSYLGY